MGFNSALKGLTYEGMIINVFVSRVSNDAGTTVVCVTPIKFTAL